MLFEMDIRGIIFDAAYDSIKYEEMFHEETYRVVNDYNSTGAVLNRHLIQLNDKLGGLADRLGNAIKNFDPAKISEMSDVISRMNQTVSEVQSISNIS